MGGLGQIAAVCATVYDRTKEKSEGVAILFGVVCQAIHRSTWEALPDAAAEWAKVRTANGVCQAPDLTDAKLEIIRGAVSADSTCTTAGYDSAIKKHGVPEDDDKLGSKFFIGLIFFIGL